MLNQFSIYSCTKHKFILCEAIKAISFKSWKFPKDKFCEVSDNSHKVASFLPHKHHHHHHLPSSLAWVPLMLNMQIKLNEFKIIIRFLPPSKTMIFIKFYFPRKSFVVIMPAFAAAKECWCSSMAETRDGEDIHFIIKFLFHSFFAASF